MMTNSVTGTNGATAQQKSPHQQPSASPEKSLKITPNLNLGGMLGKVG
jgi:hypothetical protein